MSKQCEICGKKPMSGNNVSHAHNKSRTIWSPNLQKIRAQHEGSVKTIKICTRCIRTGKVQKVV